MPERVDALPFDLSPIRSMQRRQQPSGVPWRPQQISGLDQSSQLRSRNKRHITTAFPSDNHRLLPVDDLIKNAGQVLAQARICGFRVHLASCHYRTEILYAHRRLDASPTPAPICLSSARQPLLPRKQWMSRHASLSPLSAAASPAKPTESARRQIACHPQPRQSESHCSTVPSAASSSPDPVSALRLRNRLFQFKQIACLGKPCGNGEQLP